MEGKVAVCCHHAYLKGCGLSLMQPVGVCIALSVCRVGMGVTDTYVCQTVCVS